MQPTSCAADAVSSYACQVREANSFESQRNAKKEQLLYNLANFGSDGVGGGARGVSLLQATLRILPGHTHPGKMITQATNFGKCGSKPLRNNYASKGKSLVINLYSFIIKNNFKKKIVNFLVII